MPSLGLTHSSSRSTLYQGLEFYAMCDDTSGNALDSSPNAYTGTLSGATRGTTGKINKAYTFDGVDDYVLFTNAALLAAFASSTTHSISFWASALSVGVDKAAVGINKGATDDGLSIYPYAVTKGVNKLQVWYNGAFIINVSSGILADGTLTHFAFVSRSTTDHEAYINGVSVGTSATSKTMVADIDNVIIGAYAPVEEFFPGIVDQVRLYKNKALSTTEITSLASMATRT